MKKNIVRGLALALVLVLALGIIPLGALAVTVDVQRYAYEKVTPVLGDSILTYENLPAVGNSSATSVTIKTSNYDKYWVYDNNIYDLNGVVNWDAFDNTSTPLGPDSAIPVTSSYTFKDNSNAILIYGGHQHALSYWYSDSTTHWRECLACKKHLGLYGQFMFQNWHSDGDEDRVCDVCYADIPYHEISIEEVKGGKITVDFEEAPHRRKITANVEPEEGYKLKKIHFIKVRTDGSEQEITRRKTSSKNTWWAYMPTYDLKVTAEFVKK